MTGRRVLAVRLDSDGDVLLAGPAVLALRHDPDGAPAERVDLLASPAGAAAARLLPGVDEVLVHDAPWSGYQPAPLDPAAVRRLVEQLAERRYDECVVFTSFHQSPLPMALLAGLAGIPAVAATSDDYPGSLLGVRHRRTWEPDGSGGGHEVLAALDLVAATGREVPSAPRLAVRDPLPDVARLLAPLTGAGPEGDGGGVGSGLGRNAPGRGYVVVHPGASVPARAPSEDVAAAAVAALADDGWPVVVTGGPAETGLCQRVTAGALAHGAPGGRAGGGVAPRVLDLSGRTTLPELAAVLAGAAAVVVGNTGPAHLAAAVGAPVVSLFSPVVPAERWAPFGVRTVVLGDQDAACRLTRARECPVAGHPCLAVDPAAVVGAVRRLAGEAVAPVEMAGSVR